MDPKRLGIVDLALKRGGHPPDVHLDELSRKCRDSRPVVRRRNGCGMTMFEPGVQELSKAAREMKGPSGDQ
jgi:hypothetical protein